MSRIKDFALLHTSFFIYSIGAVCAKLASENPIDSISFVMFYGLFLICLFVYAVLWQQSLKKYSLTTAFANKAITMFWGILFGTIIFQERITFGMAMGGVIIFLGIRIVMSDGE